MQKWLLKEIRDKNCKPQETTDLSFNMSNLRSLITSWKSSNQTEEGLDGDYKDLFKSLLHNEPYFLRYALDRKRPDLLLIYATDYSDKSNPVVRECNGIIVDIHDYSVKAYGMDHVIDRTLDYAQGSLNQFDGYVVEESEDGAVLTVFNYQGDWVVSTKRNIDATRVKWSSMRNFYDLLSDVFTEFGTDPQSAFSADLDPNYTYSFILLHPENHLVLEHEEPVLYYVSRRHNETLQEEPVHGEEGREAKFKWAKERTAISESEAKSKLEKYEKLAKRGILLSRQNGLSVERLKIDYRWFFEANNLRKGMPTMELSYLACNPEERGRMRYFFGNQFTFNMLDQMIGKIIPYAYAVYRESYIKKQYKILPDHPIFRVIRRIHNEYKSTGVPVRIHQVANAVQELPADIMESMIRYFREYGFAPPPEQPVVISPRRNQKRREDATAQQKNQLNDQDDGYTDQAYGVGSNEYMNSLEAKLNQMGMNENQEKESATKSSSEPAYTILKRSSQNSENNV